MTSWRQSMTSCDIMTSLYDVIWRHDITLWRHILSRCHSIRTRHLTTVSSYYVTLWHRNVTLRRHVTSWRHSMTSYSVTMSLNSDQTSHHSAKLLRNEILPNDLDLWPTTLTYNPSLAKVKVNSHIKNQCHRSNGSVVRVRTDTQTHTHTHTHKRLRFYDLDRWWRR